jgi:ATP-dependent RNA helicase RhlE
VREATFFVCAETGTGKTAAFVLPILERLLQQRRDAATDAPAPRAQVLILTPTRELAVQTTTTSRFAYHTRLSSAPFTAASADRTRAKAGVTIVATPGRLMDHMRGTQTSRLDTLVSTRPIA